MVVSDIILLLREKLGDREGKKWHINELLDSINHAYIRLARELRLFLQTQIYEVETIKTKPLPSNFLDILKVQKGHRNIPIVRYGEDFIGDCAHIDGTHIHFGGSGKYKMLFYCYYEIVDNSDELLLPHIAESALLYCALFFLLQKKPHANALQEVQFYKALYEEELMYLKRDVYRAHETKYLTTRVIVV